MNNMNIILAANILKFRKKSGLTQEELADKLGVTFQAVSKWETAKSAPDIGFLPTMADLFGCYIDELFSREVKQETHYDLCTEFPWKDDGAIRGVVCEGRKILQVSDDLIHKFTFEWIGEAKKVISDCNLEVTGSVSRGCVAGKDISVNGDVTGSCVAEKDISVGGDLFGECTAGVQINVHTGNITTGNVTCDSISVAGNVEAKTITGNVRCDTVKSERIEGTITINKEN